jgi:hypothetical protein
MFRILRNTVTLLAGIVGVGIVTARPAAAVNHCEPGALTPGALRPNLSAVRRAR